MSKETQSSSDLDRGRQRSRQAAPTESTEFLGSQVGGESVISYSYTDMPWKLMVWDTRYFFYYFWALPWIVWPMTPCDSNHLDELAVTRENIWCLFVHFILVILQLGFILALPSAFVLPVWLALLAFAGFFTLNWLICRGLNGTADTYESDPKYAEASKDYEHEQWIFLNGVAAGEAWVKSGINRLALTFKRPVLGVHNRTSGIIFDVVECLVQRNLGYATKDVRIAYKIIKEKLYNPQYSKIVFILHSQGCIEGGLVIDWLLQELPQDLLAKLEVYTFGNAANHFNNPHRHVGSQSAQKQRPKTANNGSSGITDTTMSDSPAELKLKKASSGSDVDGFKGDGHGQLRGLTSMTEGEAKKPERKVTVPASDRVIGHIEHYAHTTDFVALWGVLHFVRNEMASASMNRFIGRVFSRVSSRGGHQFCQHYLDGMFPLARDANGELTGCADSNDFMDSVIEVAKKGTEKEDAHEGFENSWSMMELNGEEQEGAPSEVAVHGSFKGQHKNALMDGKVRVKDLSRLWLYRNGRSPPEIPRGLVKDEDGVVRGATM
ncbi:hypothetical protein F4780DRAFT_477148 [Xylariomycetidae sp. FL0641]|nr:hypothetical protein F4780DRAFT_477148 [Xylariomycetidae sp. FL0641]